MTTARHSLLSTIPEPLASSVFGDGSRRKILEATAQLVAREGCQGITLNLLLAEAQVARRTFYRAFRSKDEPLRVLFESLTGILLLLLEAGASGGGSPVERVGQVIGAYLDLQVRGGRLFVELQSEALRPGSLLAARRAEVLDRLTTLTSDLYRNFSGHGLDPLVFRTLFLGLEGMTLKLCNGGQLTKTDRDRAHAVFVPLFVRALAPRDMDVPELAYLSK